MEPQKAFAEDVVTDMEKYWDAVGMIEVLGMITDLVRVKTQSKHDQAYAEFCACQRALKTLETIQ